MTELAIETHQITGGYGKTMVLREASLHVPAGSIFGLLGPNGAGKTTALRMILGLIRPIRGTIRLFGTPVEEALPGILRRVGALIEQPSLYDHLTGEDNLEIARMLKDLEQSDAERAINALGIRRYVRRRVREYSRGMRQRLGMAIAVLGNPDLLILDEPMNGLDAEGLKGFRAMLRNLNQEYGTTILVSSHQFGEIDQVATHIGILSAAGDVLFQGTRDELSARVPQELVIRVDRSDDAIQVLTAAGFTVERNRENLVVREATAEMAREANRLLVTNGIGVHHLTVELITLESLFVKVTTTMKAWDAL